MFESSVGRETMKFEYTPGSRRSRRKNHSAAAPGIIESLENRSLLSATPSILSPGVAGGGVVNITDQFQKISWSESTGAVDYDVWISDVESRQASHIARGLPPGVLEYTPPVAYNLGVSRVWVRAGFADGSHSAWCAPVDLRLQTAPIVTGPGGTLAPGQVTGDDFAVSWESAPGARRFEVFVSNQTESTSTVYRVDNLVPVQNALGNNIPDGNGGIVRQEVRRLFLDGLVTVQPTAPIAVTQITGVNAGADLDLTIPGHGLKSGETVRITGVEGTTSANGTWSVTVIDSNTVRLRGVAGNGAYTGGGSMVQLSRFQSDLGLGDYRAFVRSQDDAGRWSAWSAGLDFTVATTPQILRPSGQTFDSPITLEWAPVDKATHYELTVREAGGGQELLNIPYLQGTTFDLPGSQQVRLTTRFVNTNTLRFTSTPAGGTFRLQLTVAGSTAAPLVTPYLPWNSTAATIQSAVASLGFPDTTCKAISGGFTLTLPAGVSVQGLSNLSQGGISTTSEAATSGSYRLRITESGSEPRVLTTSDLPWNATAGQIKAAIEFLGFDNVSVRTLGGESPIHEITLNRLASSVQVTPVSSLRTGSISSAIRSIRTDWGDLEFQVRAKRVGSVTEIAVSGNPAGGAFSLTLSTLEDDPVVQTTDALAFDATAEEMTSAIQQLDGFSEASVRVRGPAGNRIFSIYLPEAGAPVEITVDQALVSGQITVLSRRQSAEVVGLWSDSTEFSTDVVPKVSLPGGIQFTTANPEISYSRVDRAARYEIWVERSVDSAVYLKTIASASTFRFTEPLPAGNYSFWVRAVSETGELGGWSEEFRFSTTAGAPIILSPQEGLQTPNPLPRLTWGAVDGAAEYEVFIAWIGVDFNYIHESGRLTTDFIPNNPLNSGTYRAWVRGVKADGTALPWSAARTFVVT